MDLNFELDIKNMLNWSLRQWEEIGTAANSKRRLINSMRFWYCQLRTALRENNVIITLYGDEMKAYPKLQKVADAICVLDSGIAITGYAKFKNKRYLSITFGDVATRNFVVQNLRRIDEFYVAYLHWVEETVHDKISVSWLSEQTDLDFTVEYISQFMEIKSVCKEETVLNNGDKCISGKVNFEGTILDNVKVDEIPHFGKIDGLECLIIVAGRQFKCYNCLKLGHRARMCTKIYCKKCKQLRNKLHVCSALLENASFLEGMAHVENNTLVKCLEKSEDRDLLAQGVVMDKHEVLSNNLFLNNKLIFTEDTNKEGIILGNIESDPSVTMATVSDQLMYNTLQDNGNCGFSRVFHPDKYDKPYYNQFITQEIQSGDPNFVLLDTSSDESAIDSEMDDSMIMKANQCMLDLADCAQVSRSLVQESLHLIKAKAVEKRSFPEDSCQSNVVDFKKSNVSTANELEDAGAIFKAQLFDMEEGKEKKGSAKKKKRNKR